ncbi:GNAT family N-acetyltransferase [Cytobacillus sp. FJAT-54145]|uniref:GNAT family N-acetyltransferase n=1 Tax=Cytobacillus spartinae TaxID=3299023 RepID=A0ABW6K704_9BACI
MKVVETDRLLLRWMEKTDAPFILELLNDPSWLKFLGDREIRTIEQSEGYISSILAMYEKLGFGLYLVELKEDKIPIGICGLLKRESLEYADIGFAYTTQFHRKGYGFEAALATLDYAKNVLRLKKVVAITSEKNHNSAKLLEKIGMAYSRRVLLPHDKEELKLFSINF